MNTPHKIKLYIVPILWIGFLTAIDQLTKFIIRSNYELGESHPIIQDVFHFTYVQNTGVAWGMFKGGRVIFILLTIVVLGFCGYIYHNICDVKKFLPVKICMTFLISGAIGNLIDRISLHYVVDFFDFTLINFPVFNVADIYVTVSMFLLIILCFFVYKNEDIDWMLGDKE